MCSLSSNMLKTSKNKVALIVWALTYKLTFFAIGRSTAFLGTIVAIVSYWAL